MDLTRENMIKMLSLEMLNNEVELIISIDISIFETIEELESHLEMMNFDLDELKDKCIKSFKNREKVISNLKNKKFHELEELGVNLKLWKLKERQKRLL